MHSIYDSSRLLVDDISLTIANSAVAVAPNFAGIHLAANGDIIRSASGQVGQNYSLLSSTNLTLPMASWTAVSSGTITVSPFWLTNTPSHSGPMFYRFVAP